MLCTGPVQLVPFHMSHGSCWLSCLSAMFLLCSTPVCELSIHRFHPHQPSGFPGWEGLLDILGLSSHTSPHTLLTYIITQLHRGTTRLHNQSCLWDHQSWWVIFRPWSRSRLFFPHKPAFCRPRRFMYTLSVEMYERWCARAVNSSDLTILSGTRSSANLKFIKLVNM